MAFTNIQDLIFHAFQEGKISSAKASQLKSLCNMGMANVAAAEIKKVQPYKVDEKLQAYVLS